MAEKRMVNKDSYTAASAFPTKLLYITSVEKGRIKPLHIQLIPTNACNLNCSICSCSDRDKKKKLTLEQIIKIIDISFKKGTKSITITGGGEPLTYKSINSVIKYASYGGIKIGLVTNGLLLDRLKCHDNLTWCRISSSDDRIPAYNKIKEAIKINPETDWAFSHVVTKKPNYEVINDLIEFSNENNFTHVRLVSNLNDLENVPSMHQIKENLRLKRPFLIDDKVIYQDRKNPTKGTEKCYISLLKPVISPEGIFPCCGAQYAIHNQKHDMIDKMKMGNLEDLNEIIEKQKYFDGSVCDICYYSQYNQALEKLLIKPDHLEFV